MDNSNVNENYNSLKSDFKIIAADLRAREGNPLNSQQLATLLLHRACGQDRLEG